MRILVTGAEGFVGSNLIPQLVKDHEVIALDYLVNRDRSNLPEEVPYINRDLSQIDVSEIPEADLVIHLATISVERISETPVYKDVNISSMYKILEYVIRSNADLIFSSSASVYGSGINFTETSPLNPLSAYSLTKILEEQHAKFCSDTYGLNVTVLRYSNCYGDTSYIENKFYPGKKGVIRIFTEKALRNEVLPVIRNQSRDFTFIDDIVSATQSVIGLKGFNIFNVGTGIETKVETLVDIIGQALDKKTSFATIPPRKIDNLSRRSLNIDKISELWKPRYMPQEGIELYIKRLREK